MRWGPGDMNMLLESSTTVDWFVKLSTVQVWPTFYTISGRDFWIPGISNMRAVLLDSFTGRIILYKSCTDAPSYFIVKLLYDMVSEQILKMQEC